MREPPADVYDECLLRLMTTNGLMLCTFTWLCVICQSSPRKRHESTPVNSRKKKT